MSNYIAIGDEVTDSPFGVDGKVTGINKDGYPEVDGKAVGWFTRKDGLRFGAQGTLLLPEEFRRESDKPQKTTDGFKPAAVMGGAGAVNPQTLERVNRDQPMAEPASAQSKPWKATAPGTLTAPPAPTAPAKPAAAPTAPATPTAAPTAPATPTAAPTAPAARPPAPGAPVAATPAGSGAVAPMSTQNSPGLAK